MFHPTCTLEDSKQVLFTDDFGSKVRVQHVYDTDSIGRHSVVSQRLSKAEYYNMYVIYKTGAFLSQ